MGKNSQNQNTAQQSSVEETVTQQNQDARPDLSAASTAAQDPQTTAPAGSINAEEQYQLTLLSQLLEEYSANSGMHVDLNSSKSKTAFDKLHHAFRILFALRGTAFKQAFGKFVSAILDAKTKAFHPKVVNYHLGNLSAEEQSAFIVFINLITRFARFGNKSKFAQNTNVSRLTELVSDPELKGLLDEVFLVKH